MVGELLPLEVDAAFQSWYLSLFPLGPSPAVERAFFIFLGLELVAAGAWRLEEYRHTQAVRAYETYVAEQEAEAARLAAFRKAEAEKERQRQLSMQREKEAAAANQGEQADRLRFAIASYLAENTFAGEALTAQQITALRQQMVRDFVGLSIPSEDSMRAMLRRTTSHNHPP